MVLLVLAAGARAGSVTVVWGLGRRRGKMDPEAAREKLVLNQHCPARSPPRARLSMCRHQCNGITYKRGRFARAARLMRGLGSAVAADKREVPGVDHDVLLFIILEVV